jgi:hypothetical protein
VWNNNQDCSCLSRYFFFFCFLVLDRKKDFLLVSFIVLTIPSPLKWGTLDLFICSNVTHYCIGNKYHVRTLTYTRFLIYNTAYHKLTWNWATIWCSCLNLMVSYDCQLQTQRELNWLNYTPGTACNNWYRIQWTLIISEYSNHTHFNASKNIQLRARITYIWCYDWYDGYDFMSVGNWSRFTCEHREFYSAEIHTHWSKIFQQHTSSNIAEHLMFCFLSLNFTDSQID